MEWKDYVPPERSEEEDSDSDSDSSSSSDSEVPTTRRAGGFPAGDHEVLTSKGYMDLVSRIRRKLQREQGAARGHQFQGRSRVPPHHEGRHNL